MTRTNQLPYRLWREWELDYLREHYRKQGRRAVASALQRTIAAVMHRARKLGIAQRARPVWTAEEEQLLREQYPRGVSVAATALGRSYLSVRSKAKRLGLVVDQKLLIRPPRKQHRWTWKELLWAQERSERNVPCHITAREIGVSEKALRNALDRFKQRQLSQQRKRESA